MIDNTILQAMASMYKQYSRIKQGILAPNNPDCPMESDEPGVPQISDEGTIQYTSDQHNTNQYNTNQYNTNQYNTNQYNTNQSSSDTKQDDSEQKEEFKCPSIYIDSNREDDAYSRAKRKADIDNWFIMSEYSKFDDDLIKYDETKYNNDNNNNNKEQKTDCLDTTDQYRIIYDERGTNDPNNYFRNLSDDGTQILNYSRMDSENPLLRATSKYYVCSVCNKCMLPKHFHHYNDSNGILVRLRRCRGCLATHPIIDPKLCLFFDKYCSNIKNICPKCGMSVCLYHYRACDCYKTDIVPADKKCAICNLPRSGNDDRCIRHAFTRNIYASSGTLVYRGSTENETIADAQIREYYFKDETDRLNESFNYNEEYNTEIIKNEPNSDELANDAAPLSNFIDNIQAERYKSFITSIDSDDSDDSYATYRSFGSCDTEFPS